MRRMAKPAPRLTPAEIQRVIATAWDDRPPFNAVLMAHGLTEGNTRTDQLSGQGSAEAIYGRPIFGRNVRLVVGKSW